MYASNTSGSTVLVVLGGTAVSLPNNQSLNGFTASGGNTIFTVPVSGRYFITYQVNTSVARGTRIINSGSAIPGSILTPALSASTYNVSLITTLAAGNQISLQIFGLVAKNSVTWGRIGWSGTYYYTIGIRTKSPQKRAFSFHYEMIGYFKTEKRRNFYTNIID